MLSQNDVLATLLPSIAKHSHAWAGKVLSAAGGEYRILKNPPKRAYSPANTRAFRARLRYCHFCASKIGFLRKNNLEFHAEA
jgi:hypothetical protein